MTNERIAPTGPQSESWTTATYRGRLNVRIATPRLLAACISVAVLYLATTFALVACGADPIGKGPFFALDRGHGTEVTCAVMSPDGRLYATGGEDGSVKLWDTATFQCVHTLKRHERPIHAIAFAPDGKTLVTGSDEPFAVVWDVQTGKPVTLLKHDGVIRSSFSCMAGGLIVNRDGTRVVTANLDKAIVWDAKTGKRLHTLDKDRQFTTRMMISPNGKHVIMAGDWQVDVWDIQTGTIVQSCTLHSDEVDCAVFASDGSLAISSCGQHGIVCWQVSTAEVVWAHYDPRRPSYEYMAVSPDGKNLATSGCNGEVIVLDVATGNIIFSSREHRDGVVALTFSHDSRFLATGSFDETVCIWRVADGRLISRSRGHQNVVGAIAFCADDNRVISESLEGQGALLDRDSGAILHFMGANGGAVQSLTFSPDSKELWAVCEMCPLLRWDVKTGNTHGVLDGGDRRIHHGIFSPDKSLLATFSALEARKLMLWSIKDGHRLGVIRERIDSQYYLAEFFPDNKRLLVPGFDSNAHVLRIFDITRGRLVKTFGHHPEGFSDAILTPDGKTVISSCRNGEVFLWDVETGESEGGFKGANDTPVTLTSNFRLGISTDGRVAAFLDPPLGLQVRRMDRSDYSAIYDRKIGTRLPPTLSSDGRYLATAYEDDVAIWDISEPDFGMWDLNARKVVHVLKGDRPARTCVFSPDGKRFATGDANGEAILWDLSTGKEIRRFTTHVPLAVDKRP